jgi:glycosyltransferase involved in cell wall biosynthesis
MNTLSGGDKRFVEIFRRFKDKGHHVTIMLPKVGYTICRNEKLNVSYQILPARLLNNLGPVLSNLLRSMLSCILVVKNFGKFDVVYSSSDFLNDTIPAFFLKLIDRRLKWVAVTHYLIPPPGQRDGNFIANLFSFFSQRISVTLMRTYVDEVITSSMFLKKQLVSLGVQKNKIQVGSNGVNIKLIDSIVSDSSRYYDACFAARLHPSKGIYDVIDTWELVCKSKPNAKLVMAGYGKDEVVNELRGRIARKGLNNNVELVGFRKSSDVYKFMKKSKLFLYGDTENGWGIAIAEAMASKCVVLAYDLPVYKEIYEDSIVYVPCRNINKFAGAILNLLSNEQLIREMGERSRVFVSRYDWDCIALGELKNISKIISQIDYFSLNSTCEAS